MKIERREREGEVERDSESSRKDRGGIQTQRYSVFRMENDFRSKKNAVWSPTALRPVHLNETQDDLHTHSGYSISETLILKWNCFSLENNAFVSESTA